MIDVGLLGLAFSAGITAFFNPCSFALLPAYLSFFMGRNEESPNTKTTLEGTLRGAKIGAIVTFGLASIFGGIGILVSVISSQISSFFPLLPLAIGPVFIVLGIFWLINIPMLSLPPFMAKIKLTQTSFFLFGVAYGLASLACVFPLFLMIIFSAISTAGSFSALSIFLIYILGMGVMMMTLSIGVALSKDLLIKKFKSMLKYVKRVAGVILIAAGIYLVYFWFVTF